MYYFGPIPEFNILGPWDRGIANRERVVLVPNLRVNLASYGVLLGIRNATLAVPLTDHFLWLDELEVDSGTWIFIYTGPGTRRFTTVERTNIPAIVVHWGKAQTIFDSPDVVPILFRIGGVRFLEPDFRPIGGAAQIPPPPKART